MADYDHTVPRQVLEALYTEKTAVYRHTDGKEYLIMLTDDRKGITMSLGGIAVKPALRHYFITNCGDAYKRLKQRIGLTEPKMKRHKPPSVIRKIPKTANLTLLLEGMYGNDGVVDGNIVVEDVWNEVQKDPELSKIYNKETLRRGIRDSRTGLKNRGNVNDLKIRESEVREVQERADGL